MYARLGRPEMRQAGEVVTDLSDESPVDWIGLASEGPAIVEPTAEKICPGVLIRGSCNVAPLSHYFELDTNDVVSEFNDVRDGISIRTDHSLILRYALQGVTAKRMAILEQLGYRRSDFETRFATLDPAWPRILACWVDSQEIVFRHRTTKMLIPFDMRGTGLSRHQRFGLDPDGADAAHLPQATKDALRFLRAEFDPVGMVPGGVHALTLDIILRALPAGSRVFVLSAPAKKSSAASTNQSELNRRLRAAAKRNPGKIVDIAVSDFIDEHDATGRTHFHRNVYYKIFGSIRAKLTEPDAQPSQPRRWPLSSWTAQRRSATAATHK
jgi:hypothetical protein